MAAWAGTAVSSVSVPSVAGPSSSGETESEAPRVSDTARGEVYVCFEGSLGAHLKQEVREKIWKGEYVEIFSLLPLERFNLDRPRKEEKKEEEERRRYRGESAGKLFRAFLLFRCYW